MAAILAIAMLAFAALAGSAQAATPTTSLVSLSSTAVKSNDFSAAPVVTPDGRYIVFDSVATNLVSPPLPSPMTNIYIRDRARGTTTLLAPAYSNGSAYEISADGRWVVFDSNAASLPGANNATQIYLWDRETGMSRRLSSNTGSGQTYEGIHEVDISDDGSRVVFSAYDNDAGGRDDTFLVQLPSGTVRRLAEPSPGVAPNGTVVSPRISGDGHWVTYGTTASNLDAADTNGFADIYRENLDTGTKQRVSVTSDGGLSGGNSFSSDPDRDGCVIAFSSSATNMAPGAAEAGTHTFVRDMCQNTTEVVSIGNDGKAGTTSGVPEISGDGCTIGFTTGSPILSPTPTASAIGLRDRCAGVTSRADLSSAGAPGDGRVGPGGFSVAGAKGRYVAFASVATNLAPGDGDATQDIFLRDRANNVGPTVAVTTSQSANRVSVDLTGSRDPDGFQLTGATSFGDGSPEVAGLVSSHEYAHAGTYTVAVTVTDADGASSRDYRTVTVTDPPPSAGGGGVIGPGGGNGRGAAGKLTLSAKLSRERFAVAPAHGKAGAGQGATLTATVSQAATLTLTFERQRKGHRSKGKCVAGGGKPKCTHYEKAGSLSKPLDAGSNQIALTGRIGSKALSPGPYRLQLEAKSGGDSAKTTLMFTVTKGSK